MQQSRLKSLVNTQAPWQKEHSSYCQLLTQNHHTTSYPPNTSADTATSTLQGVLVPSHSAVLIHYSIVNSAKTHAPHGHPAACSCKAVSRPACHLSPAPLPTPQPCWPVHVQALAFHPLGSAQMQPNPAADSPTSAQAHSWSAVPDPTRRARERVVTPVLGGGTSLTAAADLRAVLGAVLGVTALVVAPAAGLGDAILGDWGPALAGEVGRCLAGLGLGAAFLGAGEALGLVMAALAAAFDTSASTLASSSACDRWKSVGSR
mmetsp:Transcript_33335/g.84468  ORF Transcript_33335/g.84468 Transcript_33335/m.84468 type:complete len:262 (-) Transcript_33335:840-1625(-)